MHQVNRPWMCGVIALAVCVQYVAGRYLAVMGVKPDLTIICVVFFGLYFGSATGLAAGLLAGFFQDLFVLDFFGMNAFTCGVTGYLAGMASTQFSKDSTAALAGIVCVMTGLSMVLHGGLAAVLSPYRGLSFSDYISSVAVPASLLTAAFSAAIFPYLRDSFARRAREADFL